MKGWWRDIVRVSCADQNRPATTEWLDSLAKPARDGLANLLILEVREEWNATKAETALTKFISECGVPAPSNTIHYIFLKRPLT